MYVSWARGRPRVPNQALSVACGNLQNAHLILTTCEPVRLGGGIGDIFGDSIGGVPALRVKHLHDVKLDGWREAVTLARTVWLLRQEELAGVTGEAHRHLLLKLPSE
jgi:hypothetical protein